MGVARDQNQTMLQSKRGNPNVVFGNRFACASQVVFDARVVLRGFGVAVQHAVGFCKIFGAVQIRFDATEMRAP